MPATADETKTGKTITSRAGLCIPVPRVNKKLAKMGISKGVRVGARTPVYVAAAIEYIMGELIDIAGRSVVASKKKRIMASDIVRAYQNDKDLAQVFAGHRVVLGGAVRKNASDFVVKADRDYEAHKAAKLEMQEAAA